MEVVEACEKANRSLSLPYTLSSKMVIKPDQLIKRQGKQGLVVMENMCEIKEVFSKMQEEEREIEDSMWRIRWCLKSLQSLVYFMELTRNYSSNSGDDLPEDVQDNHANFVVSADAEVAANSFTLNEKTTAVVWGQQQKAMQGMLDFDWACGRATPSVAASTYPDSDNTMNKFYFGQEKFLPSYRSMKEAFDEANATVLVCFASYRSAYEVVKEALEEIPQLQLVAIIAEGVPERLTRHLIKIADTKRMTTLGGIKPGCLLQDWKHAWNDRQHFGVKVVPARKRCLPYKIWSRNSDGVYEGIKKPIIAWCIGTCAKYIKKEISFGHAGSGANLQRETAIAKNEVSNKAEFKVPKAFDGLGQLIYTIQEEHIMGLCRCEWREEEGEQNKLLYGSMPHLQNSALLSSDSSDAENEDFEQIANPRPVPVLTALSPPMHQQISNSSSAIPQRFDATPQGKPSSLRNPPRCLDEYRQERAAIEHALQSGGNHQQHITTDDQTVRGYSMNQQQSVQKFAPPTYNAVVQKFAPPSDDGFRFFFWGGGFFEKFRRLFFE
ncbi:unnamed protein product, partial [Mesorhabditis belari]|uniref:CoA-binding domain-containing protein n=1 Tax=Mesorhabditis belari TaxID=2138241 RepID=A0AAF3FRR6_9BILA